MLATAADVAAVMSFMLYLVIAIIDSSIGYMAKISGATNESSWGEVFSLCRKAPRVVAVNIWNGLSANISRMNWRLQINSESWIVRFMKRLLNLENQNLLSVSLLFYAAVFALASIFGLLFAAVQIASVVSSENVELASFRKFAVLLMMIHGPQFLLFWIGAATILCISNSVLVSKGGILRTAKKILVHFSAATGVGAALGLIMGIVSPGVWAQMQQLGIVSESTSFEAPVDGDLAVSMSSIGLVLGALVGTYTSLRKSVEHNPNRVYRELFVYLSIVVSVVFMEYFDIASPKSLTYLIAGSSDFDVAEIDTQKLSDDQLDELLLSMPPEDFAKILIDYDQQDILFQFNLDSVVLWVAGVLSFAFVVTAFIRSRNASAQ